MNDIEKYYQSKTDTLLPIVDIFVDYIAEFTSALTGACKSFIDAASPALMSIYYSLPRKYRRGKMRRNG